MSSAPNHLDRTTTDNWDLVGDTAANALRTARAMVWRRRVLDLAQRALADAVGESGVIEIFEDVIGRELPIGSVRLCVCTSLPRENGVLIGNADGAVIVRAPLGLAFDEHEVAVLRALSSDVARALNRHAEAIAAE